MKTYTVYRIDYLRQEREQVGILVDRRNKDRENNPGAILKWAQIRYPTPMDSHLVIVPQQF
jgi:hypothetical protein